MTDSTASKPLTYFCFGAILGGLLAPLVIHQHSSHLASRTSLYEPSMANIAMAIVSPIAPMIDIGVSLHEAQMRDMELDQVELDRVANILLDAQIREAKVESLQYRSAVESISKR